MSKGQILLYAGLLFIILAVVSSLLSYKYLSVVGWAMALAVLTYRTTLSKKQNDV